MKLDERDFDLFNLSFHFGSQLDDLDGGGYDDDFWSIEETGFSYGKKYYVCGTTLEEACKKAIEEQHKLNEVYE